MTSMSGARCAVTSGERVIRAAASVVVGAVALNSVGNLWCAIPAGICATFLAIGAFTGWCPTNLFPSTRRVTPEPNTLGYAEARQHIDV